MRAHDVRRLRVCDVCGGLGDKDAFIAGDETLCPRCAFKRCGTVAAFTEMYPVSEWRKMPLNVLGVRAARQLLAKLVAAEKA